MNKEKAIINSVYDYDVLMPTKWAYHEDNSAKLLKREFYKIKPVTLHLVTTLNCNHKCYFCTYGKTKDNLSEGAQRNMEPELAKRIVDEALHNGVKSIIFTGGGEPTVYRHLTEIMEYAKNRGLDISLNTNGNLLRGELAERIAGVDPKYVRVSLNAGSGEVQKLITGCDDFELVLNNIKNLIIKRHELDSKFDLSVGYVVTAVNVNDIMNIIKRLVDIESELKNIGISNSVYSIQLRPASNYEYSKHINDMRMKIIAEYLSKNSGEEVSEDFLKFMQQGMQTSEKTLKQAVDIIENQAKPYMKEKKSKLKIIFPKHKFIDTFRLKKKEYVQCLALPWVIMIWPDGHVYSCVDWAGVSGFEIGNIKDEPLNEILNGEKREKLIKYINDYCIKKRCIPVCAHHEMNTILSQLATLKDEEAEKMIYEIRNRARPKDINFL